jgi:hypothetical protein
MDDLSGAARCGSVEFCSGVYEPAEICVAAAFPCAGPLVSSRLDRDFPVADMTIWALMRRSNVSPARAVPAMAAMVTHWTTLRTADGAPV